MSQPLVARDVWYKVPGRTLLAGVDLSVDSGRSVAIVGPSGSGKTSLLHVLSGIAEAASGQVTVAGREIGVMSANDRAALRLSMLGMVFQFAELLPELSALENVALPLRLLGRSRDEARVAAGRWLERVGVEAVAASRPVELSGGEMQRVAVARALVHEPAVVLADEPTGSLDEDNASRVATLLLDVTRSTGAALVMVTHDLRIAACADESWELSQGVLVPGRVSA